MCLLTACSTWLLLLTLFQKAEYGHDMSRRQQTVNSCGGRSVMRGQGLLRTLKRRTSDVVKPAASPQHSLTSGRKRRQRKECAQRTATLLAAAIHQVLNLHAATLAAITDAQTRRAIRRVAPEASNLAFVFQDVNMSDVMSLLKTPAVDTLHIQQISKGHAA